VTERRDFEEQLRHQAFHDPLTGLPNRVLLAERTEQALRRRGTTPSLLYLDIEILQRTGFPPRLLVLEVTESVFSADRPAALEVLSRLRSIGVRISIDDFGTGYSSLSVLRDLPVDELKIDRSFVSTLTSGGDSSLVETIIRLSHDFDLSTVAEGIEVAEQLDVLRRLGCDVGQGYLLGRPGPAHAIGDLLADAAERSSKVAVGSV
jgi:EAL domain-containing protein (putative c-di-GMP-specific phosphodiesterase class I)